MVVEVVKTFDGFLGTQGIPENLEGLMILWLRKSWTSGNSSEFNYVDPKGFSIKRKCTKP